MHVTTKIKNREGVLQHISNITAKWVEVAVMFPVRRGMSKDDNRSNLVVSSSMLVNQLDRPVDLCTQTIIPFVVIEARRPN